MQYGTNGGLRIDAHKYTNLIDFCNSIIAWFKHVIQCTKQITVHELCFIFCGCCWLCLEMVNSVDRVEIVSRSFISQACMVDRLHAYRV